MENEIGSISVLSEDPITKKDIQRELSQLDIVLPRCVEDLMLSVGTDETKLPQIMQDRLKRKRELRQLIKSL